MPDAVHERVLDCRDHPLGHRSPGDLERGVDAGHHPVELGEQVVVVVERAVGQDVDLGAGEQPKAATPRVERPHLLNPLRQPLRGDVVAEAVAGGVVGDREVGVAAAPRRLGHLLERVVAVGDRGVAVEVAPNVLQGDQLRQLAVGGRRDLAVGLAQLGLDVGEPEALVDLGLGLVRGDLPGARVGDPVLGDGELHPDGALAQLDVVLSRSREVLKQVPVGGGRDDPQVDGDPVVGRDPSPALAGGALGRRQGMVQERLPERGRLAGGGDQVDVVAGLGSTPGRAGHLDRVAGGVGAKVFRELLGHREHLREQQSLGWPGVVELAQRRQHVLLGLRPEALDLADPLLGGGRAQLLEARHAQLVV